MHLNSVSGYMKPEDKNTAGKPGCIKEFLVKRLH